MTASFQRDRDSTMDLTVPYACFLRSKMSSYNYTTHMDTRPWICTHLRSPKQLTISTL
ncbi:hypothetical protein BAUCODRAFT_33549 [Baudoinia panamericana UAMH 10762]|uniref:Uncharacterized protein n=1 Tax=Baudoinia panamericana (strain UAMH 10762) TaxID=717646 RepID=M2NBD6_BAUPA|nr:uncharacterized protein BAUCODRAFT_33549 [Baudoinia panamericana UAMH 10762]EMC96200.1 hypothetical protein BAUCODRAFT_33549 [Baudoinia panamericana UAMH 10762]